MIALLLAALLAFSPSARAAPPDCPRSFAQVPAACPGCDPGQDLIRRAIVFAKERHSGKIRKFDGLPYVVHPVRVTKTLKEFTKDPEILAAGYLHDTVEDTRTTVEELEKLFGKRAAALVAELTSDPAGIERAGKAQYLVEKMNAMSDDALLIKLADRLDNVSDFDRASANFVTKYKAETEFILKGLKRKLTPAHEALIQAIRQKLEAAPK